MGCAVASNLLVRNSRYAITKSSTTSITCISRIRFATSSMCEILWNVPANHVGGRPPRHFTKGEHMLSFKCAMSIQQLRQ